jgi:hypothetical protein
MHADLSKVSDVILSEAAKQSIGFAFARLKKTFERVQVEITTPAEEIEKAISDHQEQTKRWAEEVSFSETPTSRQLADVFVPLDVYTSRRRSHLAEQIFQSVGLEEAIKSEDRSCIVFGQPGGGKTTALKHICTRFFNDPSFLPDSQVLIRVELRDLNLSATASVPEYIRRHLQELLRLRISYPESLSGEDNAQARRNIRDTAVADWLNGAHALIILDGFDEVTHKARRDFIVDEIRKLALSLSEARFIMTTRSGEFSAHIDRVRILEIMPFSQRQIEIFAENWLGIESPKFLMQLGESPYKDTAIRPLTLAHLCVIFEKSKRIPSKPKTVYRKIVRVLLEEWDAEKSVTRESAYADFESDRKEEFLANLAYELTTRYKAATFSKSRLIECYRHFHDNFGLPANQATRVAEELETHTGLFFRSGQDSFEFSHKSLQEFLTADFMVRMVSIPSNMIELQTMPNELAIAVAISSQPSEYLTQLVTEHFRKIRTSFQFTRSFVNRLLLEDPDFEDAPRVGYALLALYSQYVRAIMESGEQLDLFVLDELGKEFGELASRIRNRVDLKELDEIYDRADGAYTFEGDMVWRLSRKGSKQGRLRRADFALLPNELYLRESLLQVKAAAETEAVTATTSGISNVQAPIPR